MAPVFFAVKKLLQKNLGNFLSVFGNIISIAGTLVNNVLLDPVLAREIWMFSNPIFLLYFIGVDLKWWNGQHLSTRAFIFTYSIFTITNFYSFLVH
jgi:hypothetical protein